MYNYIYIYIYIMFVCSLSMLCANGQHRSLFKGRVHRKTPPPRIVSSKLYVSTVAYDQLDHLCVTTFGVLPIYIYIYIRDVVAWHGHAGTHYIGTARHRKCWHGKDPARHGTEKSWHGTILARAGTEQLWCLAPEDMPSVGTEKMSSAATEEM